MDTGAWRATVHRVAKSWTQLSNSHLHILELRMPRFDSYSLSSAVSGNSL